MTRPKFINSIRKWSRPVHRDLSFFFSGILLVYLVSGFMLNHKRDFNSDYSIQRRQVLLQGDYPREQAAWNRAEAERQLVVLGEQGNYLKHYFPEPGQLKIFIRGGSSLTADIASGGAVYESIRKRPLLSGMNRLHYNPSRWWTLFSDLFLGAMLLIILSGLIMVPGKKGLRGRGGIELIAGFLIPLLFIFLV